MSSQKIVDWVISNLRFAEEYAALRQAAAHDLSTDTVDGGTEQEVELDWPYLLMCASLLVQGKTDKAREAAVRIVQHCLQSRTASESHRASAALLLARLGNHPTIELAQSRKLLAPDIEEQIPFRAKLEWIKSEAEHEIHLSDMQSIIGNPFQVSAWNALSSANAISISAPTSAGKSHIIIQWLLSLFDKSSSPVTTVVVAPTRALVYEISLKIMKGIRERSSAEINVSIIPSIKSYFGDKHNALVFTQERFHLFLSQFDDPPKIDVLVIDEAHKVSDGYRGILLEQVIRRCIDECCATKIVFASPFTSNPEALLEDIPDRFDRKPLTGHDITVSQNLFWITEKDTGSKDWLVSLIHDGEEKGIRSIKLDNVPDRAKKRLPFVAHAVAGSKPGNIVYANGPAEAEDYALLISQMLGDAPDEHKEELLALSDLAKKSVHGEYVLKRVVLSGVAFHYGNMPQLLRSEIERLFNENYIKYLVCTSTLIEGVNLGCRNIFVRGPERGDNKLMTAEDFWNLAGRAGRWGQEFQGNIFCVDANVSSIWNGGGAPKGRQKLTIQKTSAKVISEFEEFYAYCVESTTLAPKRRGDSEAMLSYIAGVMLRSGKAPDAVWWRNLSEDQHKLLEGKVRGIIDSLEIEKNIVLRNPGIDPRRINDLLSYFRNRKKPLEELIPVDPASSNAGKRLGAIFYRCYKHMDAWLLGPNTGRAFALAIVTVDWMRGIPLPVLIGKRLSEGDAETKKRSKIRSVMDDVETVARFAAPKYISCYVDVLKQHLEEANRYDLVQQIEDITLFMEFGVSTRTQITLMAMGISRTSAVALSGQIVADSLDEAGVMEWLSSHPLEDLDLPLLVAKEIRSRLSWFAKPV